METTNLSKVRRNKMLNTINEIKKNITDEETLTNLSMIENELTKKKYGLICLYGKNTKKELIKS